MAILQIEILDMHMEYQVKVQKLDECKQRLRVTAAPNTNPFYACIAVTENSPSPPPPPPPPPLFDASALDEFFNTIPLSDTSSFTGTTDEGNSSSSQEDEEEEEEVRRPKKRIRVSSTSVQMKQFKGTLDCSRHVTDVQSEVEGVPVPLVKPVKFVYEYGRAGGFTVESWGSYPFAVDTAKGTHGQAVKDMKLIFIPNNMHIKCVCANTTWRGSTRVFKQQTSAMFVAEYLFLPLDSKTPIPGDAMFEWQPSASKALTRSVMTLRKNTGQKTYECNGRFILGYTSADFQEQIRRMYRSHINMMLNRFGELYPALGCMIPKSYLVDKPPQITAEE